MTTTQKLIKLSGITIRGDLTSEILNVMKWVKISLLRNISFVVKEICKSLLQRIFNHVAGI